MLQNNALRFALPLAPCLRSYATILITPRGARSLANVFFPNISKFYVRVCNNVELDSFYSPATNSTFIHGTVSLKIKIN